MTTKSGATQGAGRAADHVLLSADEHYVPTLLAYLGKDQETDCWGFLVNVDWSRGGAHPRAYSVQDIDVSRCAPPFTDGWGHCLQNLDPACLSATGVASESSMWLFAAANEARVHRPRVMSPSHVLPASLENRTTRGLVPPRIIRGPHPPPNTPFSQGLLPCPLTDSPHLVLRHCLIRGGNRELSTASADRNCR